MRVWLAFLIGGSFVAYLEVCAQTPNQPFVVAISLESPAVQTGPGTYTVKAGSDLFIKVQLTNTSQRDILVGLETDSRFGVAFLNHYEVRDSSGNLLQKRAVEHPEIRSTGHGWPAQVLKVGKTMDVGDDRITGLYDLRKPGKYTIQNLRSISDKANESVVKSNTITLVLTE